MSSAAAVLILSAAQKYWAVRSYQVGEPSGNGYTLSAISWQESSFCRYKVNSWSRGCTGLKRSTARIFDPTVTRAELEADNDRNIRDGLAYLLYCHSHTRDWKQMVYAYHWGLPKALTASRAEIVSDGYVKAISAKVRALERVRVNTQ